MSNDGASASMDDEQVWYFGYGSNMKLSVMKSRGIAFLDAQAVSVPGYMLTFDVFGLPYSEPSMASVAPHESRSVVGQSKLKEPPPVHGIAYLLSFPDFRRVVGSEGGGVAYREIRVTGVKCNDATAENLTMTTLTAKYPRRPNAAPSLRYVVRLPL
ncbi:gliotoxin biosynthesis protein [Akanthomyces lecanii RCEF 1005]|uniref:gamma-glutamylcyclotransferase n=1 Tax=Akanthomyces lecanii RCEF 1005 TaxID=1081108 RepID=A0A168GLK7_CORDF|nr:gliotoxin biosynthesis protein [Akanthomyces lecanii RCEF 1005]